MEDIKSAFRNAAYIVIVAVISILALIIIPFMNSNADIVFPTSKIEWIQWGVSRGAIVLCNIMFFFCFMQQALLNIKDNEHFIEANNILSEVKIIKKKDVKPRSPKKWKVTQYTKKTFTLALTSAISTITLTNAVLNFDLAVFLTDFFTISLGIAFGYLQMRKAEEYWTNEYWQYAKLEEERVSEDDEKDERASEDDEKDERVSREEN